MGVEDRAQGPSASLGSMHLERMLGEPSQAEPSLAARPAALTARRKLRRVTRRNPSFRSTLLYLGEPGRSCMEAGRAERPAPPGAGPRSSPSAAAKSEPSAVRRRRRAQRVPRRRSCGPQTCRGRDRVVTSTRYRTTAALHPDPPRMRRESRPMHQSCLAPAPARCSQVSGSGR